MGGLVVGMAGVLVMCGAAWLMGGWSSVVALQEVTANHRELRRSKAGVVSVTGKGVPVSASGVIQEGERK
jgi:hypothetical protein